MKKSFISELQNKMNGKKVFIRNLQEEKGTLLRKVEVEQKPIKTFRKIITELKVRGDLFGY